MANIQKVLANATLTKIQKALPGKETHVQLQSQIKMDSAMQDDEDTGKKKKKIKKKKQKKRPAEEDETEKAKMKSNKA